MRHTHEFEKHYLVPIAGGRFTAWVRESTVTVGEVIDALRDAHVYVPPVTNRRSTAWKCVTCGEQGYPIHGETQ